ncbi:MAG: tail protein X [Wolinella sp.]
MKQYIATANESLDMICHKVYGTLETDLYAQFLRENAELLDKKLEGGEVINLPDLAKAQKKERYLWD